MNEPASDLAFARLFSGFEAEMARRVVVPGADVARRAAYNRGRRNSRIVTAFTAVAAVGAGSGVTWTLAGGGGPGTQLAPSTVAPIATPSPSTNPSSGPTPNAGPSITTPSTAPSPNPGASTSGAKMGNLSVTAPAQIRLTKAPDGGFHGKVTFTVRVDGPPAVSSLTTVYALGDSMEFERGVESSGVNTCVFDGGPTVVRCSIEDQLAVGSSRSYDLNMWSGVGATGSDQVFNLKISVRLFDGGVQPNSQDVTPENNTVTVRVIVPGT